MRSIGVANIIARFLVLTWSKHIYIDCKAGRLFGFISRTFSPHCSPEAILVPYKSQVLPVLEYRCIVWDPYLYKDAIQNLDDSLRCELSPLTYRRSYFKLLATFKFLNGHIFCPLGTLNYHPSPNPRLHHGKHLLQPFSRTCSFYDFFFYYKLCRTLAAYVAR